MVVEKKDEEENACEKEREERMVGGDKTDFLKKKN